MLWTILVILLILWLLGVVTSYTLGGFIHILLVVAVEGVLAHEGGLARAAAGLSVGLWVIVVALRRLMPHE